MKFKKTIKGTFQGPTSIIVTSEERTISIKGDMPGPNQGRCPLFRGSTVSSLNNVLL